MLNQKTKFEQRQDFRDGLRLQNIVVSRLKSKGYQVETSGEYGRFPDWDVKALIDGKWVTYEVKLDRQTFAIKRTGNVCHEVFKRNKITGEKFPGGLSETKADYYVQGYAGRKEVHIIETGKLKEILEPIEIMEAGEDDNYYAKLIKYNEYVKHASLMFEMPTPFQLEVSPSALAAVNKILGKTSN